ncbi:MAG TPA: glycosyltransferase [Candidatus Sulfomarinibacteraceae bacterium]|nr:glycosyltransferase [Candidatus Sulfomarinibacteraceae bacterium]
MSDGRSAGARRSHGDPSPGSLLAAAALLMLGMRAEKKYRQLEKLGETAVPASLPALSIIVPARNEATNLPHLLNSLERLDYPGPVECIVVDDASQDETAAIARAHGATVLSLQGPPPGWGGKTFACHQGALVAGGQWLLFTDADTKHAPDGPALAVAFAQQRGLDGLSVFMKHETSGALDRVVLMAALAGYFAGISTPQGVLNGQYVLLRRDVYEKSGGFSAVPLEVLEDLALGHHLWRFGFRVPVLRSDRLGVVHMYRTLAQLWGGMVRLTIASLRWSGLSGLYSVLLTLLLALPAQQAAQLPRHRQPIATVLTWMSAAVALLPWARRFGGRRWALLAPIGAVLVQFAAIWGLARRLIRAGVFWRGRLL